MINQRSLIVLACVIQLSSCIVQAQKFNVNNNSTLQGIYLEYNASSSVTQFPSGCAQAPGNSFCCEFASNSAGFSIAGNAQFNIAVGACGSSGVSAQAEFNINSTGACGNRGNICDWVDVSTVQSSTPTVIITSSDGTAPINSSNPNSCGVYRTTNQNCAIAPTKKTSCYANNFCHNIYKPQNYTVTFQ